MKTTIGTAALALATAGAALAATNAELQAKLETMERELKSVTTMNAEFQRRQEILTTEIRKVKESMVLPETPKFKSQYGMGPAASRVYGINRGLSIGGYGQGWYMNLVEDQGNAHSTFDLLRAIIYTGYKFSDRLVFNSEIEYEHANTAKGGVVEVEFAQIDYLIRPEVNLRAGLMLIPVGFINEIHEPLFYHGNERPEVERQIIPSTWRENGIGVFGQIKGRWTYRAYLVTSGRASQLRQANLRGFRQDGALAFADDWSIALRTDYQVSNQLMVGGSAYAGDQGQREDFRLRNNTLVRPNAPIELYEAHVQYRNRGLDARALITNANIGDANILSDAEARAGRGPIASDMYGWYAEVGFDVLTLKDGGSDQALIPFFRYEKFDTQHRVPAGFVGDLSRDVVLRTLGIDYKPHPQVVVKIDSRDFSVAGGAPRPDEINVGFGYIF